MWKMFAYICVIIQGIELLPATHNCKGMRKLAMNLLLVEVGD